jgi:Xaa-Pro aminopeptidase
VTPGTAERADSDEADERDHDPDRRDPDAADERDPGQRDSGGTGRSDRDAAGARGAAPAADYGFLADAVDDAGAVAFVHVGDGSDADLRYLTGIDRPCAFVYADGRAADAVLCVPPSLAGRAERAFPGRVRIADPGQSVGECAVAVLAAATGGPEESADQMSVLAPRQLPHDAAVYAERAGYALSSTPAVAEARAVKDPSELARVRRVQAAAADGIARAAAVLAAAAPVEAAATSPSAETTGGDAATDPDALRFDGDPLTAERLRREVNAALAAAGVSGAGDTVVVAGSTVADPGSGAGVPLRRGETILVDLSPRGPGGYRGDLARTFVVDGDGGWERRAHVACESARRVGLSAVEPGAAASRVAGEIRGELAAYFRSAGSNPPPAAELDAAVALADGADGRAGDSARNGGELLRGDVHGVGLSLHEAPSPGSGAELRTGTVLAVEAGVYGSDGGVRIEDLAVVTDDGCELLTECSSSLAP